MERNNGGPLSTNAPLLESSHEGEEKKGRWSKVLDVEETKAQLFFSVPMIITNVSYYAITVISVMFAGHLGELHLAGSTLANSWATVTGFALMTSLSGALETLCGQGYGAKLYRMLGIYLQSSVITSFVFSIGIAIIWFFSEPMLIFLHQDPHVAKMAALYLRYLIPGLFAYGFIQCTLRFLQTQSAILPLVICSVVPLVIHFEVTYAFVHLIPLGYKGAPLAASLSLWISFLMLASYVNYSTRFKHTWEGLSMESFYHVLPNMKLAIPSAAVICFECWGFEILVLISGLMPNSKQSTSLTAMCVNTVVIVYMITYGFSATVSTRVSNELGAGNADRAKNAVVVMLKLSLVLALTVVLALSFGHNIWAGTFTNSPDIIRAFASMTPLLAFCILFASAQGVLSGVARGCGWQHLVAWINLGAFYIIGMPLAIFLGFKLRLYVKGLWIGMIIGLVCQAFTLLVITLCTNWEKNGSFFVSL